MRELFEKATTFGATILYVILIVILILIGMTLGYVLMAIDWVKKSVKQV